MSENLNPLYSPSNLIFLLWFQFLMISSFLIYPHLYVCSLFFPGSIHHLTSSEMVVKTMQRSQGARKCLFTAVKRKLFSSSLFFSPCLCLCCFPCPKYPFPSSIKSYRSMTHSDLTTSIQVSLVVLTHTAVTFPKL